MKPNEYFSIPGSKEALPQEEMMNDQADEFQDTQESFDAIIARINAETSDPDERLDHLYIAKEDAFNARNYKLLSKLLGEIEERESSVA